MKITCIYREKCFSPSSIDKDKAIMDSVAAIVESAGHEVNILHGESVAVTAIKDSDCILSMARSESMLTTLEAIAGEGKTVINAPSGIRLCNNRYDLDSLLRHHGIAVPPATGYHGVWIKRGDASAEVKDDIVLCKNETDIRMATERMKQRGIKSWIQQAHIPGDLVKFYGVYNHQRSDASFFSNSYPTDTGHSKFGLEQANGKAMHYAFDVAALQREAEKIAGLTGVVAYGGDAVVTRDGQFFIIDFNDWPTFSSCRDDAAKAIASVAAE